MKFLGHRFDLFCLMSCAFKSTGNIGVVKTLRRWGRSLHSRSFSAPSANTDAFFTLVSSYAGTAELLCISVRSLLPQVRCQQGLKQVSSIHPPLFVRTCHFGNSSFFCFVFSFFSPSLSCTGMLSWAPVVINKQNKVLVQASVLVQQLSSQFTENHE